MRSGRPSRIRFGAPLEARPLAGDVAVRPCHGGCYGLPAAPAPGSTVPVTCWRGLDPVPILRADLRVSHTGKAAIAAPRVAPASPHRRLRRAGHLRVTRPGSATPRPLVSQERRPGIPCLRSTPLLASPPNLWGAGAHRRRFKAVGRRLHRPAAIKRPHPRLPDHGADYPARLGLPLVALHNSLRKRRRVASPAGSGVRANTRAPHPGERGGRSRQCCFPPPGFPPLHPLLFGAPPSNIESSRGETPSWGDTARRPLWRGWRLAAL